MKALRFFSVGIVVGLSAIICFSVLAALPSVPAGSPQSAGDSPAKSTVVYVSNFDLDVLPLKNANKAPVPAPAGAADQADAVAQARRLVDLVSTSLVAALRDAGYTAQRLRPGATRPEHGVQVRGVFTEVDEENYWRRAVIRSGSDSGRMQLIVVVGNLAREEQVFYEIAPLPGNEDKPGAVITLSPYVPMARFDIDKDAADGQIKKAATRMVVDLTALLDANPAATSQ
jgi:hypothetical protein